MCDKIEFWGQEERLPIVGDPLMKDTEEWQTAGCKIDGPQEVPAGVRVAKTEAGELAIACQFFCHKIGCSVQPLNRKGEPCSSNLCVPHLQGVTVRRFS